MLISKKKVKEMLKTLRKIVEIVDKNKDIAKVPPMAMCCNKIRKLCTKGYCVIDESVVCGEDGVKLEKIWVISPTKKGRWRAKIKRPTLKEFISTLLPPIAVIAFFMGVYFFLRYCV